MAKMYGFGEKDNAKTSSETNYSDIEEEEYTTIIGSLQDKDYLNIDSTQNMTYAAIKDLGFTKDQPSYENFGSRPASPTIQVSNPSKPELSVKCKAPLKIKRGTISNAGMHLYAEAGTNTEASRSASKGKGNDIYSYAAPMFGQRFRKAATLNLPPFGKKANSCKSKTISPCKKREEFVREFDGHFALGLQKSKFFQERKTNYVLHSTLSKELALAVEEIQVKIDGERISEYARLEDATSSMKKNSVQGEDSADYVEPYDKLRRDFGRENNMTSSSSSQRDRLDFPNSPKGLGTMKQNLSFEMKELTDGDPSRKEEPLRRTTKQTGQCHFLVVLAVIMLFITTTIVAFQLFGMVNESFFETVSAEKNGPLHMLTQKVKQLKEKMDARTDKINLLRKSIELQEALIQNLQNVWKLYNMTFRLTAMDVNARMRRREFKTDAVDKEFLRIPNKSETLKNMTEQLNIQLREKVDEIQMTPGPKGEQGRPGFYSFTKCRRIVKSSNRRIADYQRYLAVALDFNRELRKYQVMSVTCASQKAPVQQYHRSIFGTPNWHYEICFCEKLTPADNVWCNITAFICPKVE